MTTTSLPPHAAVPTVTGIAITIEPTLECADDLRIHLTGELDAWSGRTLTLALAGLLPPARGPALREGRILLDLHELAFLDTGGLAALQDSRTELLAAGWRVTAGPAQPQVCRLLRLAARCGWLTGGTLAPADSAPSHLHAPPTSQARRRGPQSVSAVSQC